MIRRHPLAWIAGIGVVAAASAISGHQIALTSMTAPGEETVEASRAQWIERSRQSDHASTPTLSLKGLDGKLHSLDEWRGKVVLVNFWASWCAPCQYEIRDFVEFQNEYGAAGLRIVGVGVDEERPLRNVMRTLGINYPVLVLDPSRSAHLMGQWGNAEQMVPYSVVVDRDGRITHRHFGRLEREEFTDYVLLLLKERSR